MSSIIQGLSYVEDFVGEEYEKELIDKLQTMEWNTSISRRTQHYGWMYPYGSSTKLIPAPPIPKWMLPLKSIVEEYLNFTRSFNQVIVNEYLPGQGIAPHIDDPSLFGDTIVSVSLGSGIEMDFTNIKDTKSKQALYLSRRSILILSGDARYLFQHSITKRKKDHSIPRGTRISITFRSTNIPPLVSNSSVTPITNDSNIIVDSISESESKSSHPTNNTNIPLPPLGGENWRIILDDAYSKVFHD